MPITTHDGEPTQSTITAVLDIRIPTESDVDLSTAAKRRVRSVDGVRTARVDGLDGVQPRLSAIVTTVTVTIEATTAVETLRNRLSNAVAVEKIDRLAQTQP
jgi:hypothetical protein